MSKINVLRVVGGPCFLNSTGKMPFSETGEEGVGWGGAGGGALRRSEFFRVSFPKRPGENFAWRFSVAHSVYIFIFLFSKVSCQDLEIKKLHGIAGFLAFLKNWIIWPPWAPSLQASLSSGCHLWTGRAHSGPPLSLPLSLVWTWLVLSVHF